MSAFRSVSIERDPDRIYKALTAGAAVSLSLGVTDSAFGAVVTTALLLTGFSILWSVGTQIAD